MNTPYRDEDIYNTSLKRAQNEIKGLRIQIAHFNKRCFRLELKKKVIATIESVLVIAIIIGAIIGIIMCTESYTYERNAKAYFQQADARLKQAEEVLEESRQEIRRTDLIRETKCQVISNMNELLDIRNRLSR